jgi:hypothetical protein
MEESKSKAESRNVLWAHKAWHWAELRGGPGREQSLVLPGDSTLKSSRRYLVLQHPSIL